MSTFRPKVSIVIPVYQGANFMRKAIDSALNQTYDNIEVIVVNDGSRDDGATDQIARSYGDRIRYYAKENGGVASALNHGIEKMTGAYFSWLSHDDVYLPTKVERQVAALEALGDPTAIMASNVTVIDEQDRKKQSNRVHSRVNRSMRCFLATDTETGLNGCTLLIPRVLFEQAGLFNPALKATQDYDLWFRMTDHTRFVVLDEALVLSRSHADQGSRRMGMLPTLEADNLHAMMLSKIEPGEMRAFVDGNMAYLKNAYAVYKNAGYGKTSARLLATILRLMMEAGDLDGAAALFAERLLPDEKKAQANAKQALLQLAPPQPGTQTRPVVLVYSNVWVRGGIERVMAVVMGDLCDRYHFVLVSHVLAGAQQGFPLPESVGHLQLKPELAPEIAYVLLMLADLARAPLAIINPNIFTHVLDIYPVLKACGVKTIACNHTYYFLPGWSSWLYPLMVKRIPALKEATVATWLNTFNANVYAQQNGNGALMHNPVALKAAEDAPARQGNTILCVGRFYDAIKRLDRALKVFARVLADRPGARLVLVGGYDLNQKVPTSSPETLGELLERLDFPPGAVVFAGEQEDVGAYYRQADVLIMPSDFEGFSLVLAEGGAYGLPAVLFDIPGLDDIVTDGVNGFIVAQDDLDGMAARVVELLSNPDLRAGMGQQARAMVKRFDRSAIVERWADLIDTVIAAPDGEALQSELAERFMTPPPDMARFTRTMVREYEQTLDRVLSGGVVVSVIPESVKPESAKPESAPKEGAPPQDAQPVAPPVNQPLLVAYQELSESHARLMGYYQDVMNSKPVRYTMKVKSVLRKARGLFRRGS